MNSHCTSVSQPLYNLCDCGPLLTNSNIDTVQFGFLIVRFIETFLVDDGINGNGSFSTKTNKTPVHEAIKETK